MPVQYEKSGGQGHKYQVPDYPEAADGPKAFKDFADFLDLILPPVGTIMPFVGSTAPAGWLLCDGSSYSTASYPKLSALCGTKFGTASSGLFKVPDLKGRVVAGLDSSQAEFDAIGKTGGAKSVTLTVSNMPEHEHSVPNHQHTGSISGITATAGSESSHTHGTGSYGVGDSGGHSHAVFAQGNEFVKSVTADINGNTATTSGGSNRVTSISAPLNTSNDYMGFTGSIFGETDGGHTHTFTGTSGAGSGHTHTITLSGSLTLNSSGATTTGKAGQASPTAVSVLQPYVTLNHIIRAA